MRDGSSPSGLATHNAMQTNGVGSRHIVGLVSEKPVNVHGQFPGLVHEVQTKPYGQAGPGDNRPVEIRVDIVRDEGQVQGEGSFVNRNSWLLRSPNKAYGKGMENSNNYVSQWL
ncbi:hypothetical protein AX15_005232 [Amanita polypyramis BW_CC]|nr:hypothetical protein AX15_005232 [Amanita polypyramis BW_CC]